MNYQRNRAKIRNCRKAGIASRSQAGEHTEGAFSNFLQVFGKQRNVLNCAIPLTRAKTLTDLQLPAGLDIKDCIAASVTGNFPGALRDWKYQPIIRAEPQLPQMVALPPEHASLIKAPWLQSPSQADLARA